MKSKGFRRYLSNTSWLLFSKIYRMGLALLLTVLMARYLGPEDFGLLSYALSLVTLFSVLITLGLESLVVKEVLSCPEEQEKTIASSIALRSLGCVIFIISVTVVVLMLSPGETTTIGLVAIISTGYLFKVFEVIRYWFEAHVQAKYSAGMELIAFTFSIILKVVMIILNAPLIYFSIAVASEFVIMSLGLLYLYLSNSNVDINKLRPDSNRIIYLLNNAWPLILSTALYIIFSKIDQIMLGEIIGNTAVGIYAVSVKVSEGASFVPTMIATSLYPMILNARKKSRDLYIERTQDLLNLMVFVGVVIAIAVGLIANPLINIAFGEQYHESVNILIVHIWGGVVIALSSVSYRYLIAEGLQKYAFYRSLLGVVANVLLNLWLIPWQGAMGAAIATVVSQIIALYLFNMTTKNTRELFLLQTKALFFTTTLRTVKSLRSLK